MKKGKNCILKQKIYKNKMKTKIEKSRNWLFTLGVAFFIIMVFMIIHLLTQPLSFQKKDFILRTLINWGPISIPIWFSIFIFCFSSGISFIRYSVTKKKKYFYNSFLVGIVHTISQFILFFLFKESGCYVYLLLLWGLACIIILNLIRY